MAKTIRCERDGAVAVTIADNPPANTLGHAMRVALLDAVNDAAASDAEGIVLMGEGRAFLSGADIGELDAPVARPDLDDLAVACAAASQPVVAAMHGRVLGGGVVVAYCADRRIATADATFAMPEIALGLIATFGGTQVLPRLIGIERALALLIDGQILDAGEALAAGLIDRIADGPLRRAAGEFAMEDRGKRRAELLDWSEEDRATGLDRLAEAAARLGREHPGWDAAHATVAAMRTGFEHGIAAGRADEARRFESLRASPESRRLRRLFFARRAIVRTPPAEAAVAALRAAAGAWDGEMLAERRARLVRFDPAPLGGPVAADALLVEALGWPVWAANVFAPHDV